NTKVSDGTAATSFLSHNVVLRVLVAVPAGRATDATNGYTASFAGAGVGAGIGVTVGSLTLTGIAATNYSLTQPAGLTAAITAAGVAGSSGIVANNKQYDRTAAPTISYNNLGLNGVV